MAENLDMASQTSYPSIPRARYDNCVIIQIIVSISDMVENLDMASIWLRTAISFHIVARYDNRTPISDVCNLQAVTGASARISDYNIISAIVDGFNGVPYYVERHSNCTGGPSSISKGKDHCQ